jgi:hypothetical protein
VNHVRQQIREAVGAALVGLPSTGTNVFQSRVYPLQTADLPGWRIDTKSESIVALTIHQPRSQQRTVHIEVVGVAKATADLDDVLDQMCKEAEPVLAMPFAGLDGIARSITLLSAEFDLQGGSEKPTGSVTMIYEVDYFTFENAPDTAQ